MTDELTELQTAADAQNGETPPASTDTNSEESLTPGRVTGALPDVEENSAWRWSEETEGTGDMPDWFIKDKYKTVAEQAQAYPELSKKFGQFSGVPKEGYDLAKYGEALDMENPFLKNLVEKATTMNMSQGGIEEILGLVQDYETKNTFNPDEFMKSLSPEEKNMAVVVGQWGQNNFSDDEFNILSGWINDKQSLALLAKVRGMTSIPKVSSQTTQPIERRTQKDISTMIRNNYDKYCNDQEYRDKLEKLRSELPPD